MTQPKTAPRCAAIYARISQDRDGERAGVERQLRECREAAEGQGWSIGATYVDDDVSAYSGKPRPEYARLLADIRQGVVDGLVAWHPDRLHRRPVELEEFIQLLEASSLPMMTVQAGNYDLSTPTGRAVARTLGAWAAHESEHKGERVRSAMRERAEKGLPHGGSRPYGYEPDGMTVREREAQVIRDAAAKIIAGESVTSVADWLNERGIPTARGREWRSMNLRTTLLRARLSGQRERDGQIVGPAQWPPILTQEQTSALRAILADPARKRSRAPRSYLLAGLLRCHKCGSVLVAQPRGDRRRYTCKKEPGTGRCGGTSIEAEPIERIVIEAALYRLDEVGLHDPEEGGTPSLEGDRVALKTRLDMLTDMLAAGEMARDDYARAARRVRDQMAQLDRDEARRQHVSELLRFSENPALLRDEWPRLPLSRQQAIVKAVLDHAVIGPGVLGLRTVALERFRPEWAV